MPTFLLGIIASLMLHGIMSHNFLTSCIFANEIHGWFLGGISRSLNKSPYKSLNESPRFILIPLCQVQLTNMILIQFVQMNGFMEIYEYLLKDLG